MHGYSVRLKETFVEDWSNMYLGYLQYVSWCTNVWFIFMHVDVTIGYMLFLPSNGICVRYSINQSSKLL